MTNEELVARYAQAMVDQDLDQIASLRHADWTARWPQSGEVVGSAADDRAIMENYPGGAPQLLPEGRLVGSEDQWALSPLGGLYRVAGAGENWWGEYRLRYPDGRVWFTVMLIELRDGKVWCETTYWAEPFDAPAWRRQWVDKLEDVAQD